MKIPAIKKLIDAGYSLEMLDEAENSYNQRTCARDRS